MTRTSSNPPHEAFEINDGAVVRLANGAAFVAMICFAIVIAWMVVTPVDEVAKAHGAVEPVSQVQRLQSEFGGAIARIAVSKGDRVEAGDLIAVFDTSETASELRQLRSEQLSLLLERERTLAVVENRDPDFRAVAGQVMSGGSDAHGDDGSLPTSALSDTFVQDLIDRATAAYHSRQAFIVSARQVVLRQIEEKQAEIDGLEAERPALERQLSVAREQADMLDDLASRQLAQRSVLADAVERQASYEYQLATLSGRRAVLGAALSEYKQRLAEIDLDEALRARERITEINRSVSDASERIVRMERRLTGAQLRSPISGIIQSIPETAQGRYIEPGGLVSEIVPSNVALRFSARLEPRNAGFVTAGQPVVLKIDAYDFSRYGSLDARVAQVSPTTIAAPNGSSYYEVLIDVDTPYFLNDPERYALLPGMTGEADIITGNKTVFEYVWKPVFTNLDLAMTER